MSLENQELSPKLLNAQNESVTPVTIHSAKTNTKNLVIPIKIANKEINAVIDTAAAAAALNVAISDHAFRATPANTTWIKYAAHGVPPLLPV